MSCGDNDTQEQEQLMPRRRQVRRVDKSICQKCRQTKSMYIIRNVTFCKTCFEAAVFSRFTKSLHPPLKPPTSSKSAASSGYRPPVQSGSALIALSTGCGSTTLLDLLLTRQYIGKGDDRVIDKTKGEKEPVWRKGWVCYVDFSSVVGEVERQDEGQVQRKGSRMEEVKKWVEGRENGLGWVGLKAEDVFDKGLRSRLRALAGLPLQDVKEEATVQWAVDLKDHALPLSSASSSSSSPPTTPLTHLRNLLTSLPSSSRPQLLTHILSSLLTTVAHTLPHISHVLMGETSTRQAERLISGTALGRGWQLPLELAAVRVEPALPSPEHFITSAKAKGKESETQGFTWLKPMSDLTAKEAAIYCHLRSMSSFTYNARRWDSAGPPRAVGKTKGGVKSLEMLTENFIAGLGASHPATVSTINRTGGKLVFSGKEEDRPYCPVCQIKDQQHLYGETEALAPLLCYSCLTTLTPPTVVSKAKTRAQMAGLDVNGDEPVLLPVWVNEGVKRRQVGREKMKDEIKDFLIEE
ncbi:cytoplasmic tRNA 2-thiolation protein 2 [Cryptococcus deuterogattii LA55]|nr:cytoplasmic tRNA 2-thiolation protein 2 [Cryptococcus deuterogattii LA55]KIR36765.1 cytoplasmic tRNA 2-thiolation protein 2 [Cryptococcus deuterogattii MMRL2647]KIR92504.1 cytoplasmic tRNA 2-thiolation protein 2 [Cryptococcus deuterogattii CBS 10090]